MIPVAETLKRIWGLPCSWVHGQRLSVLLPMLPCLRVGGLVALLSFFACFLEKSVILSELRHDFFALPGDG